MKIVESYSRLFRLLLPTPFTIALLLSVFTFLIAFVFTDHQGQSSLEYSISLMEYWEEGLWNGSLMVFAMQMMLMLVLGHVLALSPLINSLIARIITIATDTARAAALVTFLTVSVAFFNWGLALIFGAIITRKIGEQAIQYKRKLNYPLIGAAGYSGLMVWHGGISGSSLIKVAEPGHLDQIMQGVANSTNAPLLPEQISFADTVFSTMNICVSISILLVLTLLSYILGRKDISSLPDLLPSSDKRKEKPNTIGAERLDQSVYLSRFSGTLILLFACYQALTFPSPGSFGFITPNFINLMLLGLCLLLHHNIYGFLKAVDEAVGGAAGILIQFPLYFGIMGIMKSSGLVSELSNFFVSISNSSTFPIYTLFSAGLVNIFVPSGGGQWAVQGPIIVEASQSLGVSLPKSILALAYGDQLTNMLQPFWALPLLGITKLKAKEILPYTVIMMLVGGVVYLSALILF
jgi:short-chain fatty acids transporter